MTVTSKQILKVIVEDFFVSGFSLMNVSFRKRTRELGCGLYCLARISKS